jgi:hypothetical protein
VDPVENDRIEALAAKIRLLAGFPDFPGFEPGGARYDHMGAIITEAALQAGMGYNTVVKPRVMRLLEAWPEAHTVDGFLARVTAEGLNTVLAWSDSEKPGRALRLAHLLADENVQSVDDLRAWCLLPDSRGKLMQLKGVKAKTADYLALVAGVPAVAVDRHIRSFVGGGSDDEVRTLFTAAAERVDVDLGVLDQVVWETERRSMKSEARPATISVTISIPAERAYRFEDHAERWLKGTAHTEWRANDHDLAVALWEGLDDGRRRILGILVDNPGRRFRASELVERSGAATDSSSLVRLLAHVTNLSERLCRAWPWQYDYPDGRGKGKLAVYWMEPDIADLFSAARAAVAAMS